MSEELWVDVGALDEIPRRGARLVRVGARRLAVFRTQDDRVFALEDKCPHKSGPLSQGLVHGASVTCPLHDWVINLESGEAQGEDEGKVPTFPARIDADRVRIDLSAGGRVRRPVEAHE